MNETDLHKYISFQNANFGISLWTKEPFLMQDLWLQILKNDLFERTQGVRSWTEKDLSMQKLPY